MINRLIFLMFLAAPSPDETAVAQLPQRLADALAARDLKAALAPYADATDLVSFWPAKAQETVGIAALREKIAADLRATRELRLRFHGVRVAVAGELAYLSAQWSERAVGHDGRTADFQGGRYTCVARKIKGTWKIVQEHSSLSLPLAQPGPTAPPAQSPTREALPPTTEGVPEQRPPLRPGRR